MIFEKLFSAQTLTQSQGLFMLTNLSIKRGQKDTFLDRLSVMCQKSSLIHSPSPLRLLENGFMKVIKVQVRVTKWLNKWYHKHMYIQPYQLGQSVMQSSSQLNKHGSIHCNVINRKAGDVPLIPYGDMKQRFCKTSGEAVMRGPMKCRLVR